MDSLHKILISQRASTPQKGTERSGPGKCIKIHGLLKFNFVKRGSQIKMLGRYLVTLVALTCVLLIPVIAQDCNADMPCATGCW